MSDFPEITAVKDKEGFKVLVDGVDGGYVMRYMGGVDDETGVRDVSKRWALYKDGTVVAQSTSRQTLFQENAQTITGVPLPDVSTARPAVPAGRNVGVSLGVDRSQPAQSSKVRVAIKNVHAPAPSEVPQ